MAEQQTALHLAARKAHKEVVKLLLDKGADPNAQTSTGVTPLYDAAQNADYETVKIMVDGGARVKTRPDDGFTPLHVAVGVKTSAHGLSY